MRKVRFVGNKKVSASDLRERIATLATSLSPLSRSRYLDHPFMVDVDRERIETFYRARGYFAAKVKSAEVTPHPPQPGRTISWPLWSGEAVDLTGRELNPSVDVTFTLNEGPPTRVHRTNLRGAEGLDADAQLQGLLTLQPGDVFDHEKYLLIKATLLARLKDLGYAWAEVQGDVTVDREKRQAEITLSISPGVRAVLGEVTVRGAQQTSAADLLRHAALERGRRFRPEALEQARGRLYELGLFSSVRIDYAPNPLDRSIADVVINVQEGQKNELRLGGGLGLGSLRAEARLRALFTRRNFFGGLRTLQLTGEAGWAVLPAFWNPLKQGPIVHVASRLGQPNVLGPGSEISWQLGYDVGIEYPYQFHGPSTQLGVRRGFWRDRVGLAASANLQYFDFFATDPRFICVPNSPAPVREAQEGAPPPAPATECTAERSEEMRRTAERTYGYVDPYLLTFLQEDFVLDLRNRRIDATKGFYLALTSEQGILRGDGGTGYYEKLLPEARGYVPLGGRVVLAARLQFGQMFVQGERGTPITRRFYLGGPGSHRGFGFNRLSYQVTSQRIEDQARDCNDKSDCPELLLPVGGDQLLLAQAEMRVQLFRLFGQWVSAAAFFDAGDVAAPQCVTPSQGAAQIARDCPRLPYLGAVDLRRLHLATGGGLRYKTVVGTLRFDLGVRLNRLDELEPDGVQNPDPGARLAYHISIGEAF